MTCRMASSVVTALAKLFSILQVTHGRALSATEIDYARDGLASSPARAAVSMWYEIRGALKPFVAHGGLTRIPTAC